MDVVIYDPDKLHTFIVFIMEQLFLMQQSNLINHMDRHLLHFTSTSKSIHLPETPRTCLLSSLCQSTSQWLTGLLITLTCSSLAYVHIFTQFKLFLCQVCFHVFFACCSEPFVRLVLFQYLFYFIPRD